MPGRGAPVAVWDAAAAPCDDAVLWITSTWARHPGPRALYADHVETDDTTRDTAATQLHLKPRFSPIHLLARDVVAPMVVYEPQVLAAAVERLATEPQPATGPGALYAIALEALGGLTLADVAHVAEPLNVLPVRSAAAEHAIAADRSRRRFDCL